MHFDDFLPQNSKVKLQSISDSTDVSKLFIDGGAAVLSATNRSLNGTSPSNGCIIAGRLFSQP